MKLSKVFAGMSALAIAGMMTITASANTDSHLILVFLPLGAR